MAQVWAVGFDDGYDVRVGLEFLDGDLWKTEYVDRTPDVLSSGWNFKTGEKRLGRALKPDNIPSKFRWGGQPAGCPTLCFRTM